MNATKQTHDPRPKKTQQREPLVFKCLSAKDDDGTQATLTRLAVHDVLVALATMMDDPSVNELDVLATTAALERFGEIAIENAGAVDTINTIGGNKLASQCIALTLRAFSEKRYGLAFRMLHIAELLAENLQFADWEAQHGDIAAAFRNRPGETVPDWAKVIDPCARREEEETAAEETAVTQ